MTDPRPLRLREGKPATDILAADGFVLATVYPRQDFGQPVILDKVISRYREAEAIAAEIVRVYNLVWRPIETAPKDGSAILATGPVELAEPHHDWPGHMWVYVVRWHAALRPRPNYSGAWIEADGEEYASFEPTHWMPIPEGLA